MAQIAGQSRKPSKSEWDDIATALGNERTGGGALQHWQIMTGARRATDTAADGGVVLPAGGASVAPGVAPSVAPGVALPVSAVPVAAPMLGAAAIALPAASTIAIVAASGQPIATALASHVAPLPTASATSIEAAKEAAKRIGEEASKRFGISTNTAVSREMKVLPEGWTSVRHEAPAGAYFVYHGPLGHKVRSKAQAWRLHDAAQSSMRAKAAFDVVQAGPAEITELDDDEDDDAAAAVPPVAENGGAPS